jgi:hypothetical protein
MLTFSDNIAIFVGIVISELVVILKITESKLTELKYFNSLALKSNLSYQISTKVCNPKIKIVHQFYMVAQISKTCWFINLFKFCNHECEITTKRV